MTNVYTSPKKRNLTFVLPETKNDVKIKATLSQQMAKTLVTSLCDMDKKLLYFIEKGL